MSTYDLKGYERSHKARLAIYFSFPFSYHTKPSRVQDFLMSGRNISMRGGNTPEGRNFSFIKRFL